MTNFHCSPELRDEIVWRTIGSTLGWVCFSFSLSCINGDLMKNSTLQTGFFKQCLIPNETCETISASPWLGSSRAFVILMLIFCIIGNALIIGSQRNVPKSKDIRLIASGMHFMGSIFGIIGLAVYASFAEMLGDYYYLPSFILGWSGAGSLFIGSMFTFHSIKKLQLHLQQCAAAPNI